MHRCKYTSQAEIESISLYNICKNLLVFEDPDARDRMRNKKKIEILTNACFLALIHMEGLMSVEQNIKLKRAQANTSENKAIVMLDRPTYISDAFDVQIAEPMLEFVAVYQFQLPSTLHNGIAVLVTWQMFFI